MKSNLTYTQIAREAGLSVMSVSNVLRTPDRVRPETKDRVHEAVRKLGGVLREDAHDRDRPVVTPRPHRRIRFLTAGISQAIREAPVYNRLFQAAIKAADEEGFELSFSNFDEPIALEKRVYSERVDALLLMGDWSKLEETPSVPLITLMSTRCPLRTHHIGYARESVGLLAAEAVLQRGVRTAAYIGPDDVERHKSFHQTLSKRKVPCRRILVPGPYRLEGGNQIVDIEKIDKAANDLMKDGLPGVVFLHSDQIAAVFRTVLLEKGIRGSEMPQLIGCNNDPQFIQLLGSDYLTISIGVQEIARLAIKRVSEISKDPLLPVQRTIIEPRLVKI